MLVFRLHVFKPKFNCTNMTWTYCVFLKCNLLLKDNVIIGGQIQYGMF